MIDKLYYVIYGIVRLVYLAVREIIQLISGKRKF
jgi:hypothetical protein